MDQNLASRQANAPGRFTTLFPWTYPPRRSLWLRLSLSLRFGIGIGFGAAGIQAAVPTLEHFHPVAAQIGTTNIVTAIGKFDPWPVQAWTDASGVRFLATTNQGEFSVQVDAQAPEGPHLVRVYNGDGASRPRFFVIERAPQTREVEPNDSSAAPQKLESLPAVINGRLDKSGDIDSFGVNLAAGQTLVASVDAYVLESPLDAVLRVTDARGVQLAWNHDERTLDPFVAYTAPEAGRYIVQVMGFPYPATSEIRYHGSEKCVYRLRLQAGPYVGYTLPLGARRSGSTRLHLAGWNLPASLVREIAFTPEFKPQLTPDSGRNPTDASFAMLRLPGVENALQIPLGDGAEGLEQEPNDAAAAANPLEVPGAVTGCLSRANDEDRFRFEAKKGERLHWSVQAVSLGFTVDAWLRIDNTDGTRVERSEGGNGRDPELTWTPGSDGTFQAVVGSLIHRGASNHWYRLSVARPGPNLQVSIADTSFVLKAGTTNDLKVSITRTGGHTNAMTLRAEGLPATVAVAPEEVPAKSGDVTLKAIVATNAPAFNGVFRIVAGAEGNKAERAATFSFVSTSENNGVPGGYRELVIHSTDQLWLTVKPPPPPKPAEPGKPGNQDKPKGASQD